MNMCVKNLVKLGFTSENTFTETDMAQNITNDGNKYIVTTQVKINNLERGFVGDIIVVANLTNLDEREANNHKLTTIIRDVVLTGIEYDFSSMGASRIRYVFYK